MIDRLNMDCSNRKWPINEPSGVPDLALYTCFNGQQPRNLQSLEKLYDDSNALNSIVFDMVNNLGIDFSKLTGKRVLLKPNWVRHDRKETDELCLTTHPKFILAVLELVLSYKPSEVIVADAPIQSCDWQRLLPQYFIEKVHALSNYYCIPIHIKDWRKRIVSEAKGAVLSDIRPMGDYTIFDMGKDSFLEPITDDKHSFRVTGYDPDRLADSHKQGKHLYCVTNDLFNADFLIAIPKAKTHQKTGITNALKLLVGINGDKDFLPHHRVGGFDSGGDCYPGANKVLRLSEHVLDMANRRIECLAYKPLLMLAKMLWRLAPKTPEYSLSAAWHGNDTTWRMVMDLNMIARYGKHDGSLSQEPQRDIFYICDGIIGGQGDGPLNPEPLPLGVFMAGTNPASMDYALARLMGFDPDKLPLLNSAVCHFGKSESLMINGIATKWSYIDEFALPTIASPGWNSYLHGFMK